MSRHDYSQNTVSNISSTILNCKNAAQNTILSTESMSYSWDAGIIHNVVTWFEVLQINAAKSWLDDLFQKADSKFEGTVQNIGQVDSTTSSKLESTVSAFSNAINIISDLENILSEYSQISEHHVWMNEREATIYSVKEYVSYDSKTGNYFISDENYENLKKLFREENLDYAKLTKIVDTFTNSDGSINTESVEKFVIASYTDESWYTPDPIQLGIDDIKDSIRNFILKSNWGSNIKSVSKTTGSKAYVGTHEQMDEFLKYYLTNGNSKIVADILENATSQDYKYGGFTVYVITTKDGKTISIVEKDGKRYEINGALSFVETFGNVKIEVNHSEKKFFDTSDGKIAYYETEYKCDGGSTICRIYDNSDIIEAIIDDVQKKEIEYNKKSIIDGLNELIEECPDIEKELGKQAADKIINAVLGEIPGYSLAKEFADFGITVIETDEKTWNIKLKNGKIYSLGSKVTNFADKAEKTDIIKQYFNVCGVTCNITTAELPSGDISWDYKNVVIDEAKTQELIDKYNKVTYGEKVTIDELKNPDLSSEKIKSFIKYSYDKR